MRKTFLAVSMALVAAVAAAQQPVVSHARLVPRTAGSDLPRAFDALLKETRDAAWVGYTVPAAVKSGTGFDNDRCGRVELEPPARVMVLYRIENHEVRRIRTYAPDCELDAGGLTLYWFEGVSPAQSVAVLKSFVVKGGDKRLTNSALSAIALHNDPAVSDFLENLLR